MTRIHNFLTASNPELMGSAAKMSFLFVGRQAVITCYDDSPFGEVVIRLDLTTGRGELILPEDFGSESEIVISEETVPLYVMEVIDEAYATFRDAGLHQG